MPTQIIYDDQLENGWQNWSWATVGLANTTPVQAGTHSIAVTDTSAAGYEGVYFHTNGNLDDTPYKSITFWVNGGAKGGQRLQLTALANGVSVGTAALAAPAANTWAKVTVPLASVNAAANTTFSGFWIEDTTAGGTPTYYLDSVQLDPDPAYGTTPATVTVSPANALNTIPPIGLGMNVTVYDPHLTDGNTVPLLTAAGIDAVRFPGGSTCDGYHWATNSLNYSGYAGGSSTLGASDSFDSFMTNVAQPAHAQPILDVNYGTNAADNGGGDPAEAAAWVKYANITKGYGVKYWEIGNEIYGNGYYTTNYDWEPDLHDTDTTPADRVGNAALGPVAYGQNVNAYAAAMKAVDPTIKIGVVMALPGADINTTTTLPPWNANVLQQCGHNIDFVILHWYPQYLVDSDAGLLSSTQQIAGFVSGLQTLINQYCGANAPNVKVYCTETNNDPSPPGKQTVSTVNALFMADQISTWLENGAGNVDYFLLRANGIAFGDDASTLFGTTMYGDYGALSSGSSGYFNGVTYTEPPLDTPFPTYYAIQMEHYLGAPGDTMIASTANQALVTPHAVRHADGSVSVLLINKDPVNTYYTTVNVPNYPTGGTGTQYTYGPATGTVQTTPIAAAPSVTVTLPPYTMETLALPYTPPVAPTPVIATPGGTYSGSVTVSISDALAGAAIKFTTDGTNPATSATARAYTAPFSLSATATVNAVATETGYANSQAATASYAITAPPLVVYDDQLENGWQNWSWATVSLANTTPVQAGAHSIAVTDTSTTGYQGVYFHAGTAFNDSAYNNITFWINGGAKGGQRLQLTALANNVSVGTVALTTPAANTWAKVTVPLASVGAAGKANFTGFWVQDTTAGGTPTYYLDTVQLSP